MRDFTNIKIGFWTIISFHHKTTKYDFWNARCKCGKERVLRGDVIKRQRSECCRSCANRIRKERGFIVKNRIENRAQALINIEYSLYKGSAKNDDREFNLSKDIFKNLILSNCHYCCAVPNRLLKDSISSVNLLINGVDRIDSAKGYKVDNVVTCCAICNRMKNVLSVHEFKSHIAAIYANLAKF